ncbi:galanin receptor type 1-like [Haliotis rubra]|uniref:galanin receptor type 1-like n=1 Tax=Haliotis rubra TaxID=36100 RepID=UPI001EE57B12|nr:galanin receptor type 1-like [Haliotis rubra]
METFFDYSGIFLLPNVSIENLTDVDGYVLYDDGEMPPVDHLPETIIVPVLYLLIVIGGVITNSAALTFIYRRRKIASASDTYFASHFIGNIVFLSVFVPIIAIAYGITDWVFGGFACKSVNYGMTVCVAAAILSVTAACLHHTLESSPVQGDKTLKRNHRITKVITASLWMLACVVMVPRVFLYNVITLWHIVDERRFCSRKLGPLIYRQVDTTVMFLALFCVPLMVQFACCIRVLKDLRKQALRGQNVIQRQNVAKVLAGISSVMLLGWLPTHIINFCEDFADGRIAFQHRDVLAYGCSYVYMLITPLLYLYAQRRIQKHAVSKEDVIVVEESCCSGTDLETGDALTFICNESPEQKTTLL